MLWHRLHSTFSPAAKLGTIRLILRVAATEQMDLVQCDVSTACLYREFDETIYMEQPEGYEDGTTKVCEEYMWTQTSPNMLEHNFFQN